MDIGKVGIWFFLDAMTAPDSAEFAKQVEKNGYKVIWIPEAAPVWRTANASTGVGTGCGS